MPASWEDVCSQIPSWRPWPWDQLSRNTLLGYMLWLTSRFRMSERALDLGVSVLDRCAACPACARPASRPESSHRYLLATTCLFVAFKFDDGVECRNIPEQGLKYDKVEPTRVWRHAMAAFNALPAGRPATTVAELCKYERNVMAAVQYRLFVPTPRDAVHAALPGPEGEQALRFAASLAARLAALLPPQAAPPRARVQLALAALGLAESDFSVDMARQELHGILRGAPALPGTGVSSLLAWQEHLACAAVHAPALVPAGVRAQQSSCSSERSCGAKMKRTTD